MIVVYRLDFFSGVSLSSMQRGLRPALDPVKADANAHVPGRWLGYCGSITGAKTD